MDLALQAINEYNKHSFLTKAIAFEGDDFFGKKDKVVYNDGYEPEDENILQTNDGVDDFANKNFDVDISGVKIVITSEIAFVNLSNIKKNIELIFAEIYDKDLQNIILDLCED